MTEKIIALIGTESPTGRIRLRLDMDLPHNAAMAILKIVHDVEADRHKAEEAARKRAEAQRAKLEEAERKAAAQESARAAKAAKQAGGDTASASKDGQPKA